MGVKGVEIEGVWEVDPRKVKEYFKSQFENHFKRDPECHLETRYGKYAYDFGVGYNSVGSRIC